MAKRRTDDDDAVRTFSDDTPDEEAMRDGRRDEEEEAEPEPLPDPEKTPEYWRNKFFEQERAKADMVGDYKEKINQLQEEKRKAEADRYRNPDSDGTDGDAPRNPSHIDPARGVPPYQLVKYVETKDALLRPITVAKVINGFVSDRYPQMEDVPEPLLIRWGAGDYKIRDSTGKIVGGFSVGGGYTDPSGSSPPAQSPLSLGQFIVDPVDRALKLFDEAQKRNDPKLAQMAADALQHALQSGPANQQQGDQLSNALGVVTALIGAMNQVKTTFATNGLGAAEPPEIAMKRMEMEMAAKRMEGIQGVIGTAVKEVKGVLPEIIAAMKKPDLDPVKAAEAAQRMSTAPQPSYQPATYTPAAPSPGTYSPPSPPTRAQGGTIPPGTMIRCGGCGKEFTPEVFVRDHAPTCIGGPKTPPPTGVPAPTPVPSQTLASSQPSGGTPTPIALPNDLKAYLGYLKSLSTYIFAWEKGEKDASPESVAGVVWMGTTGRPDDRNKLLELADKGVDKIMQDPELVKMIKGLDSFPNFTPEQISTFIMVATAADIMTPNDVTSLTDVTDLAPALDELRNHIRIQTSPKGREWFAKFLNGLAMRGGRAVPHPEFLPGGSVRAGDGRDNL